jgi:putative membrane protein
MNRIATLAALAAFASLPALAQQKMDNADAAALKQLAQSSLNEIEAGQSAESKAQSAEVREFAKKMQTDHTKMLDELKSLAQARGVALPQSASVKDMAQMKMMGRASGADFDRQYLAHVVKDHQKDVKETEDLAAKAKDPDFRKAVQHANAKVREHLQLAQRIAGQTSAAGGSSRK